MAGPIVLCGYGRVGRRVRESLAAVGVAVVVVDVDPMPEGFSGSKYIRGDSRQPETLARAGIATAAGAIIVTSDDLVNVTTALVARSLNPTARIVVRMFNQNLLARLGTAVKNTAALSVSALTGPFLALTAVAGETLAAVTLGDESLQIAEGTLAADSPLIGQTLGEAAKAGHFLPLAHIVAGKAKTLDAVDPAAILRAGDTVVACGKVERLENFHKPKPKESEGVLWAGRIRRTYRLLRRTLWEVDTSVKIATITLFVTLFASAMVFRFAVGSDWAEAIYQTVSVVATGAELKGENQPGHVKVFLSVLKIAGAALIAAFTAIFTQYLLRAKLGGAFETRKIPDGGHVVVCGLGNIGFRCVEELVRLDCSVVAIDQRADAKFAATVRRMGAAVIVGDATVAEVLKQARADTARAVVAVTSSELANLEIGLVARELNPAQRVVVRLTDMEFAEAVREAADIRYAFSVPALAGPAFVAALYGERVQAMVTVGKSALAVGELVLQPSDSRMAGKTLGEIVKEYRYVPLGLAGAEPFSETGIPLDRVLQSGDRLTAVFRLKDLERLLRDDTRFSAPA